MMSATSPNSSSPNPRVARAGVPMRRPEETIGGRGSNGTALRLTVMPIRCSRSSPCCPSSSESRRSTRTRCTSVPPLTTEMPASATSGEQPLGEDLGAVQDCAPGAPGSPDRPPVLKATALAAITCSSGPPCWPGKTAELIFVAFSSLVRMTPPRGPPSVLCVVVVTTSAYGTGLGCSPAATRPAKCAMSTIR